jgi:hypothetical protein
MADTELNPELQEKLQLVMACRYGNYKEVFGNTPWQSTSISELVAGKLFDQHAEVLSNVPLRPKTTGASVTIDGEIIWCYGQLDW